MPWARKLSTEKIAALATYDTARYALIPVAAPFAVAELIIMAALLVIIH